MRVAALVGALALAACAPVDGEPPTEPYVLVLGTAQDAGLPQIGCRAACCERVRRNPGARRLVTSLLLCDPRTGQRWLLDASPDLAEQVEVAADHPATRTVEGARPPLFDGVFLTHAHMGHYAGLLELGREAYGAKGLVVHGTERMRGYLTENGPWSLLVETGGVELRPLEPGTPVALAEDLRVTPLLVPHRDEFTDTVAFLVEGPTKSLLYLPDVDGWDRWDTAVEDVLARVDHALLDATFFSREEVPGRSIEDIPHPLVRGTVERFAALPDAERAKVLFTHLNHSNPIADPGSAATRTVREAGMRVAVEGMLLEL